MKKYRIKSQIKCEDMSKIEIAKRELAKYEFLSKYLERVISKKEMQPNFDTYKLFEAQCKIDGKIDEIKKKYLTLGSLKMSYEMFGNKNIFNVADVIGRIYDFFEENTEFSREYIIEKIDESIFTVEIYKEFENNPYGCGFFDSDFGELAVKESQINKEDFEKLLRHEITHVLGHDNIKKYSISGYAIRPKFQDISNNNKINSILNWIKNKLKINETREQNVQFNEACVEMFAHKDQKLEQKNLKKIWGIDVDVYTNFSKGSFYLFNANLVRQMIIANGVSENDLYKGLFNYKHAEKVIKKFKRKTFKKISVGMDEIYESLSALGNTDVDSKEEKIAIEVCKESISKVEKTIIDEILLPKISKISNSEKDELLEKYYKFIIFSKDYFIEKTGFNLAPKDVHSETQNYKDKLHVEPAMKIHKGNETIYNQKESGRDREINI